MIVGELSIALMEMSLTRVGGTGYYDRHEGCFRAFNLDQSRIFARELTLIAVS
jgi:hypothetical protein